MADSWQKDAKGILIFVSDRLALLNATYLKCSTTDRPVFCCSRCATRRIHRGSQAKSTRYLRTLSDKNLSDPRQSKLERHRSTHIYSSFSPHTTSSSILSSDICRVGEFTLVSELSDQPYMCTLGNVGATMGTSLHQA